MSKKDKSTQFPKTQKAAVQSPMTTELLPVKDVTEIIEPHYPVKPEQMSLDAHRHIQIYLKTTGKNSLDQEDLNAVLRLSQHLRVFGLVSAVGYINQSNDQEGKVRKRTVPVWRALLGQLLDDNRDPNQPKLLGQPENNMAMALMKEVVELARNHPSQYMALWRKSLILVNHWNFWARAYKD